MNENGMIFISQSNLEDFLDTYFEKRKQEEEAKSEKEFISEEEAKKILHKSSTTLWRYVRKGYLDEPQKQRGRNQYKRKQVMALL